jgi:outer membrane protein
MNRRTEALLALFAALLAAGAAFAAEAPKARRIVPLREALALANKQGPDVAAAQAQAAVVAAGVNKAWTAWQPDVSAGGQFDHTSAPQTFALGQLVSGIYGGLAKYNNPQAGGATALVLPSQADIDANFPNTTIVAENSWYGNVQISQPLLTPQGLFLPGVAKKGAEAAAFGADEAREQVLLGVARAYYSLQGIDGLIKAAKDLEAVSVRREDEAKAQIKAGTAVELTLLRAQTDTANARVQLANLEGSRESLLPVLEALCGEPIEPAAAGSDATLAGPSDAQEPWEGAYSVKSAVAAVKSQAGMVDLDKWAWLPSIQAQAKGNYNSNSGFSGKNTSYDLIVAASIPLYDRGTRYAARTEDEAKLRQSVASLAKARASARSAWLGAKANVAAAQAALAQSEAQVQLATRAQAQVDASYKAGVATSLDLSDADNKKFTAQSAAAQARSSLEIRKAELIAAEGRLFATTVAEK